MEESNIQRDTTVAPEDVIIEIKDGSFAWGFRVQEN